MNEKRNPPTAETPAASPDAALTESEKRGKSAARFPASVLLAPDSFKGSLSASRFCEIASDELRRLRPEIRVRSLPIADGGEGTLETLRAALGGRIETVRTLDPFGDPCEAEILITSADEAVIEIARCVGLSLVTGREDPEKTSTVGIGRLIAEAADRGAKRILLTLGGSCTNDCGAGMLAAMGFRFLDRSGESFVPTGGTLGNVAAIEKTPAFDRFSGIRFTAMCDVRNPLCGKDGCARVFAPQKGADTDAVERLDAGARSFARVCADLLGTDVSGTEGAGAAGGLGFACRAFLNAELKSGIETVLDLCGFDRLSASADLVITGEGRFDAQSMMGKAIGGIFARSAAPVAVLCGQYVPFDAPEEKKPAAVVPIAEGQPLGYALGHAEENLRAGIARLLSRFD